MLPKILSVANIEGNDRTKAQKTETRLNFGQENSEKKMNSFQLSFAILTQSACQFFFLYLQLTSIQIYLKKS